MNRKEQCNMTIKSCTRDQLVGHILPPICFEGSFMHKWALPEDCDVDAIHTQLNDAGHLSIEAPKTGQHPRRRNIPIMAAPKKKH
ncbi:hypothetical protein DICVIV_04130 [Dictyocaulus viviparus]|uniref:SHSP domain-containing protein n=1 Tax=Dictyocaulus viviparus TaxID=29172 RepID=A0A0D8Y104_DICVI|nr:hypothetical protein DICVIV_04130 [Dictyocaulus viviparus]